MGIYSEKQREQISIEALNRMLRITTQGRVQSYISDNDKEPMWDGNIYGYSESGSERKSDFLFRIPVQVKSKQVTKFDNQFVSFPIETVCLQSYFNDGGIIYFVVEIKISDDGDYDTKIFYKILMPSILKDILDTVREGQETKKVHINKVLNSKDKFFDSCVVFDKIRKIEGIDLIKNRLPIEKVLGKKINITTISGLKNLFNGDYCSYYIDENNIKVPVKLPGEFTEFTIDIKNVINFDENRYFDNCKKHINNIGEEFITFGDTIKIGNNKNVTIMKSKDNIYERHKTIEYFIDVIIGKNIIYKEEELEKIKNLKNEKEFIEDVLKVCNKFNINRESVKLKDFKERDFNAIEVLCDVNDEDIETSELKEIKCEIVRFLNYRIALLKMIYKDGRIIYHDFYSNKINLCIVSKSENRKVELSRFVLINERLLTTYNFNKELILESLSPIRTEYADIESEAYNLLILTLIKAWDLEHRDDYISLIKHLEKIIDKYIDEEIEVINKAQLEYRLSNKKLSHKTIEKLYRIKFRENIDDGIKCAICILLEDYDGFEDVFAGLGEEEKETFKNYPIYSLYEYRNYNTEKL